MSRFGLIWSWATKIALFLGGLAIMAHETLASTQDRPWLFAAALGMMGLPFAGAAEAVLSRFANSGQPGREPEKPDPPAGAPPAQQPTVIVIREERRGPNTTGD